MTRRVSFTLIEKKLTPQFREKINRAEGVIDLENFFSHTVVQLLDQVLDGSFQLMPDDVQFDASCDGCYKISTRLKQNPAYRDLMKTSDLEQIIQRFASAVSSRYVHFRKHPERTPSNIRN